MALAKKMIRILGASANSQPFRLDASVFYPCRRLFCSGASPGSQFSMLQNEVEKLQHIIDGVRNDIAKVVEKHQLALTHERRLYLTTVAHENAKRVSDLLKDLAFILLNICFVFCCLRGTAAKMAQFMCYLIPFGLLGSGAAYKMSSKK